jgi:hypothetical protein
VPTQSCAIQSDGNIIAPAARFRTAIVTKEIRFSAFAMNCVAHQSPGLWAHPRDRSSEYDRLPDVGYTGDLSFLTVYAAGAPIKAIGGTRSDARTQEVLVRNDSPIKTAADLKGKKLAGTRAGWVSS